jgi:hypothetical protein
VIEEDGYDTDFTRRFMAGDPQDALAELGNGAKAALDAGAASPALYLPLCGGERIFMILAEPEPKGRGSANAKS